MTKVTNPDLAIKSLNSTEVTQGVKGGSVQLCLYPHKTGE